jgi:hypothetical protein
MCTRNDGNNLRRYCIKSKFVDLSRVANRLEDLITAVKMSIEKKFAFLDSNTTDSLRLILRPSQLFLVQHDLMYLDEEIQKFCSKEFPLLIKSSPEILLSLKDGPVQERHTDFCVDSAEDIELAKLCRICILAVSGTASIMVYRSDGYRQSEIKINAGDLFVGRGTLIHNGMSYKEENLRIHWYFDCAGSRREEDATYPLGLDLEAYYNSRLPNPCADFRERVKENKDYIKEHIKKMNNLKRSRQHSSEGDVSKEVLSEI